MRKKNAGTVIRRRSRKKLHAAVIQINKRLALLAGIFALGGFISFLLVVIIGYFAGGEVGEFDLIWILMAIPFMGLLVALITGLVARSIYKNLKLLTDAMNEVASGKTDVSIPIAKMSAFTGVYEDFNKMAAEIAGIQKLRHEIVDNLAHELKTPAASINGFAKILLEEQDLTEEKRKKYLTIIVKESDRIACLAKENLFLSKMDAQEIITDKEKYNLGQQIQEVAISQEPAWSKKNISLTAKLSDVFYEGNAVLMESLWQNLLSNAIKFTPNGGNITIALMTTENEITVSFKDTGIGMNIETQAKIFERYYKGDTSHASEGHGLGLSIANRIIRLCGGKITVNSKEGEGSSFTVVLPK